MAENCATCRHYAALPLSQTGEEARGECRRLPPAAVHFPHPGRPGDVARAPACYPLLRPSSPICGEYAAREEAP